MSDFPMCGFSVEGSPWWICALSPGHEGPHGAAPSPAPAGGGGAPSAEPRVQHQRDRSVVFRGRTNDMICECWGATRREDAEAIAIALRGGPTSAGEPSDERVGRNREGPAVTGTAPSEHQPGLSAPPVVTEFDRSVVAGMAQTSVPVRRLLVSEAYWRAAAAGGTAGEPSGCGVCDGVVSKAATTAAKIAFNGYNGEHGPDSWGRLKSALAAAYAVDFPAAAGAAPASPGPGIIQAAVLHSAGETEGARAAFASYGASPGVREAALTRAAPANPQQENDMETAEQQINRLADFIMLHVPGEPSQNEGAVDTAIRLLAAAPASLAVREAAERMLAAWRYDSSPEAGQGTEKFSAMCEAARHLAAALAAEGERCPETVFPDGTGRCTLAAGHGGRHHYAAAEKQT